MMQPVSNYFRKQERQLIKVLKCFVSRRGVFIFYPEIFRNIKGFYVLALQKRLEIPDI